MSFPAAPQRSCQVDLTLDLAAPRASRNLLELLLPQWGLSDLGVIDRVALVLSELVTHALSQSDGGGPVTIGVELRTEALRLWVLDRSSVLPAQRSARLTVDDARGLVIVGQIAARWGVEPHDDGRRSFADVPLAPVPC